MSQYCVNLIDVSCFIVLVGKLPENVKQMKQMMTQVRAAQPNACASRLVIGCYTTATVLLWYCLVCTSNYTDYYPVL